MSSDQIPDPRDSHQGEGPQIPSELHPASLAAFESWCRDTHSDSALNAIERYRRDIRRHGKLTKE